MNAMKQVSFFAVLCVTMWSCSAIEPNTTTIQVNVGVVLDMDTWIGKLGLSCIDMALSDFYASHTNYKTRIALNIKHSNRDLIAAASAAIDLIKNARVEAIIGPQYSRQANFIIDVGNKAQVPIISFSATSPSLNDPPSPYFFRVAQSDAAQVAAITTLIQAFEWNQAVPIYEEGLYGEELIPPMIKALQEAKICVPNQIAISPSATDEQIAEELYKLMMISNRVFIVHMPPILGSRVFTKARDIGMMNQGYVWIMTTIMSNVIDGMNSSVTDSMQGVLGVATYFPKSKVQQDFEARWKLKFQKENPSIVGAQLNVLGLWAYDATVALATAVEMAGVSNLSFQNLDASNNATDFDTLGVSQSGPKLCQMLSKTAFKGLAGEFNVVNGEVNSSTFQVINVIGDGKNVVGYWTPHNGLERKLSHKNVSTYSASKVNLGPIIWVGDSSSAPKGWDIIANSKKLRVGVPIARETNFSQLVKVHYDYSANAASISGYCVDVFKATLDSLSYVVAYEFIPFGKTIYDHDHVHQGAVYDDLIQKVYLGELDAAVGDITILFKRSLHVDFTLPFTESGSSFIVPTKEKNKTKAWIFLKPLTWQLWLTSGCFFLFIGFVVWILEHRINEEFRGSPSQQICTTFWFSFSTMVFAQNEKIHSSLARVVVMIWVFVVLILTQSYTASFTTLLTVEQLLPAVTDVNQLLQSRDSIGYQSGSFTYGMLKQMGFDESRLQPYYSPEDCDRLLTIGSKNGGIAAAFDEIPYLKLMEASYCSKYTTVGPTYKSPGFGFAFQKNSPLVMDVSRAILNLTEQNQSILKEIEHRWFNNETRCLKASDVDASYSLDLDSFRGLFLVAGVASFSALIMHTAVLLFRRGQQMRCSDPKDSIWERIWVMLKIFYLHKDPTFPGCQNNNTQQASKFSGQASAPLRAAIRCLLFQDQQHDCLP